MKSFLKNTNKNLQSNKLSIKKAILSDFKIPQFQLPLQKNRTGKRPLKLR